MRVRQCEECGIEYGTETIDSETFRHVFPEIVELGAKNAELKRLARRWQQEYFNEKKQLEQKIAENAELRGCKRHCFGAAKPLQLGQKLTCQNCGGTMGLTDIGNYIRGYQAAGGAATDIITDWWQKGARDETNIS